MKTVVEHLLELVRIPSASLLSNRSVIEYASEVFREAKWSVSEFVSVGGDGVEKVNLIAAPRVQDVFEPVVDLAFLCHTDTFVQDGVVYGCGACDVKGFLACLLVAAEDKAYEQQVRIVLTADEEIGCLGSHRLVAEKRLQPRKLVVGEPTSLHAARAGKGYCLGEVIVFGAEAHSAHPQQGRSAIYAAAKLIVAIEQLAEDMTQSGDAFFDPPSTTINVGVVQGGTAKNIVPGECRFLVEWRPVPGDASDVPAAIERLGRASIGTDRFVFKVLREQMGFETAADAGLVLSVERLTGQAAVAIPFGSEASVFRALAEEIVVFGPGDMRTAHSSRECVAVAELDEAVRCVRALMVER
jgi:acetylornithine deacetylase